MGSYFLCLTSGRIASLLQTLLQSLLLTPDDALNSEKLLRPFPPEVGVTGSEK